MNLQQVLKVHKLAYYTGTCILSAQWPASQSAVWHNCVRCSFLRVTLNNIVLLYCCISVWFIKLFWKQFSNCAVVIPCFFFLMLSSLLTDMCKQLTPWQHSIQGDNNSINMCLSSCTHHYSGFDYYFCSIGNKLLYCCWLYSRYMVLKLIDGGNYNIMLSQVVCIYRHHQYYNIMQLHKQLQGQLLYNNTLMQLC